MKCSRIFLLFTGCIVSLNGASHSPQVKQKKLAVCEKEEPKPIYDESHRLDAQIMAQHFINIVIQVFIAAHKEQDKEARLIAIVKALQSLANIFKLIIRSAPVTKKFNNQEEIVAWLHGELMSKLLLEECDIAVCHKGRYLKTTEKAPRKP